MKIFTKEEFEKILENHMHWLHQDCNGWGYMRANLDDTDLRGVDLIGVNLSGAYLRGANLYGTELCMANLSGATLCNADLRDADLRGVDLSGADLSGTNLYKADLRRANLYNTNLYEANLYRANLYEARNVPFIPMVCPETGSFTAWKKVLTLKGENLDSVVEALIELEIPTDAKRSSATARKCRCNKAFVKSIISIDGSESFENAFSSYDNTFIYRVGEMVCVDNFEEDRFKECAPGIHFFISRQKAVNY